MRTLAAFLLGLIAVSAARADDWPQWMGPKRDNVWREKGILDTFPKDGPKVLWRAKVSHGFSGPAVADGLVFVTDLITDADVSDDNFDREKYNGKERVQCFDAKTGELKWKHDYPVSYNVSYPNGPRCTPAYDAGKVYTLGAVGDLICFEATTGKILWSRDFKKDYGVPSPLWGFAAHPLVDGSRLICMVGGAGSIAVAFDKNTGKEIWKNLTADQPGYSPPSIIESGGVRQLLIWHPESLNSLNPETGKVYWSVKQATANGTSIMTPRKLGEFIFIGAWQQKGGLFKLDADKLGVQMVWKGNRDTSVYPVNNTPFLEDGHIYGVCNDGELRCVEMKTGDRLWESLKPVADKKVASGTAHLIKHEGRFFIVTETGDLVIAKLSPKGYNEISRWHMHAPTSKAFGRNVVWSHPAFAQQCVFARNDKELICVSLAK
jgi:outer membrane protein assembly factor BamB